MLRVKIMTLHIVKPNSASTKHYQMHQVPNLKILLKKKKRILLQITISHEK